MQVGILAEFTCLADGLPDQFMRDLGTERVRPQFIILTDEKM